MREFPSRRADKGASLRTDAPFWEKRKTWAPKPWKKDRLFTMKPAKNVGFSGISYPHPAHPAQDPCFFVCILLVDFCGGCCWLRKGTVFCRGIWTSWPLQQLGLRGKGREGKSLPVEVLATLLNLNFGAKAGGLSRKWERLVGSFKTLLKEFLPGFLPGSINPPGKPT